MQLEDATTKPSPADVKPLGTDKLSDPCNEAWGYASVVGMMMYLAANSHPDIAFAVHQCAHFTHCPRASHERALKQVA